MNDRIRQYLIIGSMAFCFCGCLTVHSQSGQPEPALQLTIELTDGSKVIGKPDRDDFELATPYATIRIPLAETRKITLNPDDKVDAVLMRNGDQLSGVAEQLPTRFQTLFGDVRLKDKLIRKMDVQFMATDLPVEIVRSRILYLPFDRQDGNQTEDLSPTGIPGTVVNAQWIPEGVSGGAYEFNGQDAYIELGPSDKYSVQEEISGSAWVRMKDRYAIFISNYRGGSFYRGQFIFEVGSEGYLELMLGQNDGQALVYRSTTANLIPMDEWHHVAFSCSLNRETHQKIRLFIDGRPVPGISVLNEGTKSPLLQTHDRIRLMAHRDNKPIYCRSRGSIDEVMLYNRALSDDEIRLLVQQSERISKSTSSAKDIP